MGVPPVQFFRKLRAERAKELLVQSDMPVGQIAATLAFASPEALKRAFRQRFGMTPLHYRRVVAGAARPRSGRGRPRRTPHRA